MKIPSRLVPLVEDGIIDDVLGQVKSGKEADVFIVQVGDEVRCAKVYKDADHRSFRQAALYREGRKVQNSRSARAIAKSTRFGKKEAETSWIGAEVAALQALSAAGVRVPKPYGFFDGVLIMELILDADGMPAPRLNDLALSPETALLYHEELIAQVVRMLCAGFIHGDLSEFNVLVDVDGPVIIDLPQAVNAAGNNSAAMLFARDVDNLARWFGRFEPGILSLKYAKEIWALYEKRKLTPDTALTGRYQEPARAADVGGVLDAIGDARREHESRLRKRPGEVPRGTGHQASGGSGPRPGREMREGGGRGPEKPRHGGKREPMPLGDRQPGKPGRESSPEPRPERRSDPQRQDGRPQGGTPPPKPRREWGRR